jgi:hypothetical protein
MKNPIDECRLYKEGWNGYRSKPIETRVLDFCAEVLDNLTDDEKSQWKTYPSAENGVHFSRKSNGNTIEFCVFGEDSEGIQRGFLVELV